MLSNTITLTDGAVTDHIYDLVSREGYTSVRRDTTLESSLNSTLTMKSTIDASNPTAKNRHLIQVSRSVADAVTGELYPMSAHIVISRDKRISDAVVEALVQELQDYLVEANSAVDLTDVLRGGN